MNAPERVYMLPAIAAAVYAERLTGAVEYIRADLLSAEELARLRKHENE